MKYLWTEMFGRLIAPELVCQSPRGDPPRAETHFGAADPPCFCFLQVILTPSWHLRVHAVFLLREGCGNQHFPGEVLAEGMNSGSLVSTGFLLPFRSLQDDHNLDTLFFSDPLSHRWPIGSPPNLEGGPSQDPQGGPKLSLILPER